MKRLLIFALAFIVISCNQTQSEKKDVSNNPMLDSLQQLINIALDQHTLASNNYDVKGCGELFTDDASYINYGSEEVHITGRKSIDSLLTIECGIFKQQQTKFDIKWTTHSLRLSNGIAYHDASVEYTIKTPEQQPMNAAADALIAWKKAGDNNWRIHTLAFYSH